MQQINLFQRGVRLTIATAEDNACAFKSFHKLFVKFLTSLHALLFDTDKGFSRQKVTNILWNTLLALEYIENYSGYLFQQKTATSTARSGLSEEDIITLGRWKLVSYKLYIEMDLSKIVKASQKH